MNQASVDVMTSVDGSFTCVLATGGFTQSPTVLWYDVTVASSPLVLVLHLFKSSRKRNNPNQLQQLHVRTKKKTRTNVTGVTWRPTRDSGGKLFYICNVTSFSWVQRYNEALVTCYMSGWRCKHGVGTGNVTGTPTVTSYLQLSGTHRGSSPCRCRAEVWNPAESCPRLAWAPNGRGWGS